MMSLSWVVDCKTAAQSACLGTIDMAEVVIELESRGWAHTVK